MICQHCGKVLDNDKLSFCVMCGYPLKSNKKGFFAKSEITGSSRADEYAAAQISKSKSAVPAEPVQTMPSATLAVQPTQQSVAQPQMNIPQTSTPVMQQNPQMTMPQTGVPMMQQNPQMGMTQTSAPMMQQNPQMGMTQAGVPMMQQNPQMGMPQTGVPMIQQTPQMNMPQTGVPMMQQNPQMSMPQAGVPMMQQPQMGMQQVNTPMMQPQMGMQQGTPFMPQSPQMGMPMMQQKPQMGMMPEMGEPVPAMMGMPHMAYAMPQMQYGMPQLVGYDAAGNPMYMQTVPQLMGYDAYGNPMYTMVSIPCVMPQMQGMQMPVMGNMAAPPMQPVISEQTAEVQTVSQQMPEMPEVLEMPEVPETEVPQTANNVETTVEVTAEEMPMSAESLMVDDAQTAEPTEEMSLPSEEELLDRIFSDTPKGYTMCSGTKPAAMTFSISLGANEITNVRDEEAAPPATEKPAKPKKKAEPKEEKKAAPKKKTSAKKVSPIIVSPDEFFDDKPRKKRDEIDVSDLDKLDDNQLVEQLAVMETSKKKSHRSMKAATAEEMDRSNMVDDPALMMPPQ